MSEYGWDVVEPDGTKLTVALVASGEKFRGFFIGCCRFSNGIADYVDRLREAHDVE